MNCTPDTGFTNCARFTYSGSDQTFTVPSGAISLNIRAWGANGAQAPSSPAGGGGGFASGNLAITAGTNLTIVAGGSGGGYGGGGYAAYVGGGMSLQCLMVRPPVLACS